MGPILRKECERSRLLTYSMVLELKLCGRWNKGRAGFWRSIKSFLFIIETSWGMQRTAHIVKLHTQPIVRHYLT